MSAGEPDRRLGLSRLTARSVIASTLLGASPPELPTRSLVETAALLGIAPGTARVAMSRMVAAGELAPTGAGYRLVGPTLLARQARQTRSRAGTTDTWDGNWRMLVVTADARPQADRAELRSALTARRYAELREGVWLRPDNLGSAGRATLLDGPRDDQRTTTRDGPDDGQWTTTGDQRAAVRDGPGDDQRATVPDGSRHDLVAMAARPDEPVALAASLWDLGGWADRARLLLGEVDRLMPALEAGHTGVLAEGFVVSAAVLRHFQADPLLPAALLPAGWPGRDLRERYDGFDAAFRTTLQTWQHAHR